MNKAKEKQPYTVQVVDDEVKKQIKTIHEETGIAIKMVATELIREGLKSKKFGFQN